MRQRRIVCCALTYEPRTCCVRLTRASVFTHSANLRCRVYFAAGDRLLRMAGAMFERQCALTASLAVAPDRHLEQVNELARKVRDSDKRASALSRELAEATAARLASDAVGGAAVVTAHRDAGDLEWMKATITTARELLAQANADVAANTLILLSCGVDGDGAFVLAGPADAVKVLGPRVGEMFEGRGGGKDRYQGKAAKVSRHPDVVAMLRSAR